MTPKRRRRPNRPAPPWLPDWKREQSYPRTLSLDEWRWQFLRRRREYQDAYEAAPDEGWESAFLAAGKTWTAEIRSATPQQKRKYGVPHLLDPATPKVPLGYFRQAPAIIQGASHGMIHQWNETGFTLALVDLTAPLDPQLSKLARMLTAKAKERGFRPKRADQPLWRRHLRVLDAYAVGASPDAIGANLHDDMPPKSTVSRWHRAAKAKQKQLTDRVKN